jgi:shikimate dehydrogenase
MKKIMLIGENISESLSPAIHNGAIEYLGLADKYHYELMPVASENFCSEIKKIMADEAVAGFNITAPYKCRIINYLDEIDNFAQKCGACNYVKKEKNRWIGKNTDGYGFIMPIIKKGLGIALKKAVVMGAGGAARAVVLQLINNGVSSITMFNRDMVKAAALKEDICKASGFGSEKFLIYSYLDLQNDKFSSIMSGTDLIINATSAGAGEKKLPVLFNAGIFNKNQIIYDISYTAKADDDFKQSAAAASALYIDGREMLMYQALVSFVQWTSKKPPVWLLRKIVFEALDGVK